MKTTSHLARRTLWLLSAAPVLLATSAIAQDAPVAPPAVRPTVTQSAPAAPVADPAPAPAVEAAQPATAAPKVRGADPNSTTPINPAALEVVDEARQAARSERRAVTRPAPRAQRATPAPARVAEPSLPAAAAPAVAPAPPPAAAAPEATPPAAPAPEVAAPVADTAATEVATTTTQDTGGTPVWPWIALGAVIVLGAGLFLWRRGRANAYAEYEADPVYAEPAPVAVAPQAESVQPVAVAPVAAAAPLAAAPRHDPVPAPAVADDATIVDAGEAEVAALTDGAPVQDRPWLEFAMRPVRAGTNVDEALVEIELTIANAGNVAAQDVRVSTFMLTDAHAGEVERLLVDPPADAAVDPVTIQPGEGARIDATLAALKTDIGQPGGGFTPVVVADARYRLPDGSEGRTSASFVVGVADAAGNIAPFAIDDREMRDDIEARLHGEPQRV